MDPKLPKVAVPAARILPVDGCKVLGTIEKPAKKVLAIEELKASAVDGVVTITGYANTKGHADRYGDVPTVFAALRNYVYELADFSKNPVMLLDHRNQIGSVAGSFKILREDEKGLWFQAEFSKSNSEAIAHARCVYLEGHAKALSIAGRFYFEDKDNPTHLTYANIAEISLVGVGADQLALVDSAAAAAPKAEPVVAEPITAEPTVETLVTALLAAAGVTETAPDPVAAELSQLAADIALSAEADEIKRLAQSIDHSLNQVR